MDPPGDPILGFSPMRSCSGGYSQPLAYDRVGLAALVQRPDGHPKYPIRVLSHANTTRALCLPTCQVPAVAFRVHLAGAPS